MGGEVGVVEPAPAEGYLTRLARLPSALEAIAERHRAGVAAGRATRLDVMASRSGRPGASLAR